MWLLQLKTIYQLISLNVEIRAVYLIQKQQRPQLGWKNDHYRTNKTRTHFESQIYKQVKNKE